MAREFFGPNLPVTGAASSNDDARAATKKTEFPRLPTSFPNKDDAKISGVVHRPWLIEAAMLMARKFTCTLRAVVSSLLLLLLLLLLLIMNQRGCPPALSQGFQRGE